jgi:hypothetical protein
MKIVRFHGTQIKFKDACVQCLMSARETYPIERTFVYGRKTVQVRLPVPMCPPHLKLAKAKSRAQVRCERLGLAAGIPFGLAVSTGLMMYWSATGQDRLYFNLPLALVVGASMAFTLWAIVYFWIAPRFASPETKAVINSVWLAKYDPYRQILELAFANDTTAELTRRENLSILAEDTSGLSRFHISAQILSHDIRLNGNIKTDVLLDHVPTVKEAEVLLQPVVDWEMARNLGEGCFYEVDCIEIEKLVE